MSTVSGDAHPLAAYTGKASLEAARFDPMTEMMDVALIDAEWLLQQGQGPPGCRQQLPEEAFFEGSVDDENVEVLGISYPWLTKEHPDPEGWHLAIIQHFLRLYFTLENKGYDDDENAVTWQMGHGKRVAIFWDWMSLFQASHPGGQTEEQRAAFKRALKLINIWYANNCTMVWRQTKLPPAPRPGHNIKKYHKRGWCFFELGVSEMISPSDKVLDLGLLVGDDGTFTEEGMFFTEHKLGGLGGGWAAADGDEFGALLPTVVKQCSTQRQFPMPPEAFDQALDQCTFTNGSVGA